MLKYRNLIILKTRECRNNELWTYRDTKMRDYWNIQGLTHSKTKTFWNVVEYGQRTRLTSNTIICEYHNIKILTVRNTSMFKDRTTGIPQCQNTIIPNSHKIQNYWNIDMQANWPIPKHRNTEIPEYRNTHNTINPNYKKSQFLNYRNPGIPNTTK